MLLESLGSWHGVDWELGEVLFSYYLKEHDVDKGRYKLIARVGRALIVICLLTNDCGWKDKYLFCEGRTRVGAARAWWRARPLEINK